MKTLTALLTFATLAFSVAGQNTETDLVKRAAEHFEAGTYAKALPMYSQLLSLNPESPEYNFRFGACAIYGGKDKGIAVKHLIYATKKGVTDARAWYFLGLAHHLNYEFKEAENAYREFGRKADTKLLNRYPMNKQLEMAKNGSALLKSIKDVIVLDKKQGGEDDFFRYFDLESTGGKILVTPEELLSKLDKKPGELNLIYFPKGATEIFFSSRGKDGTTGRDIYKATVLPDGKFSTPTRLSAAINTGFDENFAFMHPDGQSFYFASQGHNSMGGYDIFRSQFDAGSGIFGKPVNVDFAINTPDDDIFYITDAKNELAYFASSRNAEQGVYNVYKVRVEGIPLELVFIQGEYISQIDPKERKAKITVTDELTGRKIDEQTTDPTGRYLLSLPKSGRFKLEVKPQSSTLTHEAFMQVPVFPQTVALRQELILTKEDGKERLTVNNFFQTPLDIDVAGLSASLLRSKAALEVNADAAPAPVANPDLVFEKKRENAPLAAGFDEGVTIESIIGHMKTDASTMEAFAAKIKEKSAKAYSIAETKQKRTAELNAEIKAIKDKADPNEKTYVADITRAYKLIQESQTTGREARSALELAKQTEKYSESEKQRARDLQTNAIAIQSATDFDKTVALVSAEKERQRKEATAKNPGQAAADMADMKESEALKSTDRLLKLREEESGIAADIKRTQKQRDESSKKKEQAEFDTKLKDLTSALADVKSSIQRQDKEAVKLSEDGKMFKLQSKMYDELMTSSDNYGVSDKDVREMSSSDKTALAESVSKLIETTQSLQITDENVLGLVAEEMKKTQDTTTASSPTASTTGSESGKANPSGQSKPTPSGRKEYDATKERMAAISDPKISTYREAFLAEQTVRNIDKEIELLKSEKSVDPVKVKENEAKVKELELWRSELQPAVKASAMSEPVSAESKAAIGNLISKDYAKLNDVNVPVALMASNLQDRLKYISSLDAQRAKRGNEMLNSNSPAEIQSAIREISVLNELEKDMLANLNPATSRTSFDKELAESKTPIETASRRIKQLEESKKAIVVAKALTPQQRTELTLAYDNEIAVAEKTSTALRENSKVAISNTAEPIAKIEMPSDLPAEDADVLEMVYPGFAVRNEASKGKTDEQSMASRESTLREAKMRLNNEIEKRKALLDQLKTSDQQEKVQVQIQQLNEVKERIEVELKPLERALSNEVAIKKYEAENDTVITFAPGTTESEKQKLLEILQPAEPTDPDYVFENEVFYDLVASNEDSKLELKNGQAMAETKAEIATLEMQIQNETSQSKIRKLDLRNEDLYGRLALQELANADKYAQMVDNSSVSNLSKIEELEAEKREMLLQHNWLSQELETLKEEAAKEMKQADEQREEYKKTPDPIKKNFYYREALAWELSALERQKKAINILEEANLVVKQRNASEKTFEQRSEERKEAIAAIAAGEEPKPLSKAVVVEPTSDILPAEPNVVSSSTVSESGQGQPKSGQTAETAAQNTANETKTVTSTSISESGQGQPKSGQTAETAAQNTAIETKTVTSTSVSESSQGQPKSGQTTETTAQNTANEPKTVTSTSVSESGQGQPKSGQIEGEASAMANDSKYNDIKVNDRDKGVNFSINDETYIRKAFKDALGLSTEQTGAAMNNPEVKSYLALVEKAKTNQTELSIMESERATLVSELEKIQAKIKTLEAARDKAETQAEKDALTVEINNLRAQAEVIYNKVVALDNKLDTKYSDQEKLLKQIKQSFENIDLDQIADKTSKAASTVSGNSESAAPKSSKSDDPTTALIPENKPATTGDPSVKIPSSTTASDAERMEAAKARYGVNAKYFVFPKTLTEDLFSTNATGVYSDKNPIPMDAEMPDGIIFKVQVGAFRNNIPQNLFGGFAPVMGEKLNNGVTRYMAGLFIQFDNANQAKEQIRKLGYPDAFVVAYKNGKRIPMYEALGQSPQPTAAQPAPKKENLVTSAPVSENKPDTPDPKSGSTTKAGTNPAGYYADFADAAKADVINDRKDFFYTVQVGVYSKPVPVSQIFGIQSLNSEVLPDGKVRYSTGRYSNLQEAAARRENVKGQGVSDAFVTAYSNGKRITIEQAQALENGTSGTSETVINAAEGQMTYDVLIGKFSGSVPDNVARAMLDLSETAEIKVVTEGGMKVYKTGIMTSKSEAEKIANTYKNLNVTDAKVRAYENGQLKE